MYILSSKLDHLAQRVSPAQDSSSAFIAKLSDFVMKDHIIGATRFP